MSPDDVATPAKKKQVVTTNNTTAGLGRWNRKKRGVAKKHQCPKAKMTKEERRAKYTAIARERQQRHKSKDLVCYNCRERGHSIQQCPRQGATSSRKKEQKVAAAICYKCGSTEHTLSRCKRKDENDDSLPFATCFICGELGHLASTCPKNEHGIYVNGEGCCKRCGSKHHRGSDCPDSKKKNEKQPELGGRVEEVDVNDLLEGAADDRKVTIPDRKKSKAPKTMSIGNKTSDARIEERKKRRVVNF